MISERGNERPVSTLGERTDVLDRFGTPLYSVPEAARYLDVPASTLTTWTHGYRRRAVGRREESRPGESHPRPLAEPDLNLSTHPAPILSLIHI